MASTLPPDVQDLIDQLDAAERDVHALTAGLSEDLATRRPPSGGWCITECLDHLAVGNRIYLAAMQEPARRARAERRVRSGPAKPGLVGGIFVWLLEPPPRWWSKLPMPASIRPAHGPPLAPTLESFLAAQARVREFMRDYGDLDLARIGFPNPFVRGIRFSLATGLHVITAHQRRHLLQAWKVRRALEQDGTGGG
jgi:hypothetical protein